MLNALFQKRPLRDSVPKMAPKGTPTWLHFQLLFALVFDPFLEPLQISFLPKPTRREEPKGPKRRKRDTKMEPKWDPNITGLLLQTMLGASLFPKARPKRPRPHFLCFRLHFCPPSLRFIDFWLPFLTVFCRSLNGEQPQRTIKSCRKPFEISTATLHCHHFAFCRTPAAATNARTKPPSYKMGGRRCSRRMAHSDNCGYVQR